jgi:hypothetical protein
MPGQVHRERDILDLWERGVALDRWRREDALLAGHAPPSRRLGARNTALLALRNAHFHGAWPILSTCPHCGIELEFTVDSAALLADLSADRDNGAVTIEWRGTRLAAHAPTVEDLRAAAMKEHPQAVARTLLAQCLEGLDADACDDDALEELGAQLEALDPAASVQFDLTCPDCAHAWPALLDIGETLWAEVRNLAERTLLQVDALARAYGWSEAEVLALSPLRRAAYLQLAEAQ